MDDHPVFLTLPSSVLHPRKGVLETHIKALVHAHLHHLVRDRRVEGLQLAVTIELHAVVELNFQGHAVEDANGDLETYPDGGPVYLLCFANEVPRNAHLGSTTGMARLEVIYHRAKEPVRAKWWDLHAFRSYSTLSERAHLRKRVATATDTALQEHRYRLLTTQRVRPPRDAHY